MGLDRFRFMGLYNEWSFPYFKRFWIFCHFLLRALVSGSIPFHMILLEIQVCYYCYYYY